MRAAKKKKSEGSGSSSGGAAQRFLLMHGEKIVGGILVVVALWFAIQGLGYQTPKWAASELENEANVADAAIKKSDRKAADENGVEIFDFAEFAKQIRDPIPTTPYHNPFSWHPVLPLSLQGSPRTLGGGSDSSF